MLTYLAVWAGPAFLSVLSIRLDRRVAAALIVAGAVPLILMIGYRQEIGTDWFSYVELHLLLNRVALPIALVITDPAYALLNRAFPDPADGIYLVNLVCAALFVGGLVRFALDEPFPAVAVAIAAAYLIVVVALGYTRQAAAIGVILWALTDLRRARVWRYLLLVVVATLFHKSAIVMLPLAAAKLSGRAQAWMLAAATVTLPVVVVVLAALFPGQLALYASGEVSSGGALQRTILNAIPAAAYLAFRPAFGARFPSDAPIHRWMAWAAIASVPLTPVASTVIDRVALYLIPLQMVVWGRLPLLARADWRPALYLGIVSAYGFVLYYWLSASFYAQCCWLPYRSVL